MPLSWQTFSDKRDIWWHWLKKTIQEHLKRYAALLMRKHMRFVEYLVSAESQAYWATQTGYFPVTNDAYNEDVFKQNIEQYPQFQTAIDQLNDTKGEYAGALLSVFPEARQTVQTEIENTLNDKETPEEAVQKMADTINASIEDYNLLNE